MSDDMSDETRELTTKAAVMNRTPADLHGLVASVAEGLDAIKYDRLGAFDPVEDWLYDPAWVLVMDIYAQALRDVRKRMLRPLDGHGEPLWREQARLITLFAADRGIDLADPEATT